MVFDWTFNVGNVLTIVVILGSGIGFAYKMIESVNELSRRATAVEIELKQLVQILVNQGRHEERMSALDQRLTQQGQRLDDLTARYNEFIRPHP